MLFRSADGIAWGVISYCAIKLMQGKHNELNPVMWGLFVFMMMFYLGPGETNTFDWLFDAMGLN